MTKVKFMHLDVRSLESWNQVWDEAEVWLEDKVMSVDNF